MPVVMLTGQGVSNWPCRSLAGSPGLPGKGQLTADTLQHAITTACNTVRLRQELAAHQQSLRLLNATLEQRGGTHCPLELMQDITRAANEGSSSAEALQYAVQRDLCLYTLACGPCLAAGGVGRHAGRRRRSGIWTPPSG